MPASAVGPFGDETITQLFPGLRRAWSVKGEQSRVAINGRNDRLVLFGTITIRTGHRVVAGYRSMGQNYFQQFLRLLRCSYQDRPIWMLLDGAGVHKTAGSLQLAAKLDIRQLWVPKQCPELNAMDHLWDALK